MTIEITLEQIEELRLDFAERAMAALIPTFGEFVEPKRNVIAHKSFLMADAMVTAYVARNWERPA